MNNIFGYKTSVSKKDRENIKNQTSKTIWLTGLSGSGKSTLANALEVELNKKGYHTMLLDGDNIRTGLCKDLGFSEEDRAKNIKRIAEVAKLFCDAGIIVITAFISPFRKDREMAREVIGEQDFVEVYCECPLDECIKRDVKGLYKKAISGEIKEFTGISSPYEEPENPQIIINTTREINYCINNLLSKVL